MSDFSLILDHPDSKEIISKLVTGSSPKEVSQWLKIKYPEKDQSHLRLTQKLLKEFSDSQYTQYYDQLLEDKAIMSEGNDKDHLRMSAALANNKFYRERMEELVNTEINLLKTCEMASSIVHSRMEQMFDLIQQDPTEIGRADNTFIRYVQLFVDTADKLEKMRLNSSDHLSDHNITMQTVQEYLQIYQEVIRETFASVDPDMANRAMELLYDKLNNMEAPSIPSQEDKLKIADSVKAKVLSVENSVD